MSTRFGRRPPIALIYVITLTGITANTLVSPGIPDILAGLGASQGGAGLVLASASLPGVFLAPIIGILADRYGRRRVLAPCLVLFAVAGGLEAAAPSLTMLALLRFFQGAGSAGLINLTVVIIGDHWDGLERARMIGRNSAVLTAGLALLPAFGGLLTDAFGWRGPFYIYPLALVPAVMVWRRLGDGERLETAIGRQVTEAVRAVRRPRLAALLGTSMATFVLIFGLVLTVVPLYAEDRFGLGAGWRGALLGVPAIATFLVAYNLGLLAARFGRGRLLLVGAGCYTVGFLVTALAPSLPVLGLGLLGAGMGEGFLVPTLQEIIIGEAPAEGRGAVVAAFTSAARAGQTVGPLLAGGGLALLGARNTFVAGAAGAGMLLVAGLVVRRLPAMQAR